MTRQQPGEFGPWWADPKDEDTNPQTGPDAGKIDKTRGKDIKPPDPKGSWR